LAGPAGVMLALILLYILIFSLQAFLLSRYHNLSMWHLLSLRQVVLLVFISSGVAVALKFFAAYLNSSPMLGLAVAAIVAAALLILCLVCMGDRKNLIQWLFRREI